jgi:hypothetical protein
MIMNSIVGDARKAYERNAADDPEGPAVNQLVRMERLFALLVSRWYSRHFGE